MEYLNGLPLKSIISDEWYVKRLRLYNYTARTMLFFSLLFCIRKTSVVIAISCCPIALSSFSFLFHFDILRKKKTHTHTQLAAAVHNAATRIMRSWRSFRLFEKDWATESHGNEIDNYCDIKLVINMTPGVSLTLIFSAFSNYFIMSTE